MANKREPVPDSTTFASRAILLSVGPPGLGALPSQRKTTAIRFWTGLVEPNRAWMTRGYAIGLGAGTQPLTLIVGEMIAGPPTELSRALVMGAGWAINLAVAEWAIRKRPASPARRASTVVSHLQ